MNTANENYTELDLSPYGSLEEYIVHNHDGEELLNRLRAPSPDFFYADETATEIYSKYKTEVDDNVDIKEIAAEIEMDENYIANLTTGLVTAALLRITERIYEEYHEEIEARPHALLVNIVNKRRTISYEDLGKNFNYGPRYDALETTPLLIFRLDANSEVTIEHFNAPYTEINDKLAVMQKGSIFHGENLPTLGQARKNLSRAARAAGLTSEVVDELDEITEINKLRSALNTALATAECACSAELLQRWEEVSFAEYTHKTWETVCGFLPAKSYHAHDSGLPEIPPTAFHYADNGCALFDFLVAEGYQHAGVLFTDEEVEAFIIDHDYKNLLSEIVPSPEKNKIVTAVKKFVQANSKVFPRAAAHLAQNKIAGQSR